jgi:hypothetical protein
MKQHLRQSKALGCSIDWTGFAVIWVLQHPCFTRYNPVADCFSTFDPLSQDFSASWAMLIGLDEI